MRLDERIVPVDVDNDNSLATVEVAAEVYWKGNLHPTRRLLTAVDDFQTEPRQPHSPLAVSIHDASVRVKAQTMSPEFCQVSSAWETAHMEFWLASKHGKTQPNLGEVMDWASSFQISVEGVLNVYSSIKVESVSTCESILRDQRELIDCKELLHTASNRRLQSSSFKYMKVKFAVKRFESRSGGRLVNEIQGLAMNPESELNKLPVFGKQKLFWVIVDECDKAYAEVTETKELSTTTSSASSVVPWVLTPLVAFIFLLA